jgi:hypothetical protein
MLVNKNIIGRHNSSRLKEDRMPQRHKGTKLKNGERKTEEGRIGAEENGSRGELEKLVSR